MLQAVLLVVVHPAQHQAPHELLVPDVEEVGGEDGHQLVQGEGQNLLGELGDLGEVPEEVHLRLGLEVFEEVVPGEGREFIVDV